jgi:hypothetical protein
MADPLGFGLNCCDEVIGGFAFLSVASDLITGSRFHRGKTRISSVF